jgi:hypothetical protein
MVTFEEIAETWRHVERNPSYGPQQTEFRRRLTSPTERAWFRACANGVAGGLIPDPDELPWKACIDCLGPVHCRVARAHLACSRAARCGLDGKIDGLIAELCLTVLLLEEAREDFVHDSTSGRYEASAGLRPREPLYPSALAAELARGFLADGAAEARGQVQVRARHLVNAFFKMVAQTHADATLSRRGYFAEAWNLVLEMLGSDRTVVRKVETVALLVSDAYASQERSSGLLAPALVFERLDEGLGALYPAPPMAFVSRPRARSRDDSPDDRSVDFRDGEREALQYARKVWNRPHDVRFSFRNRELDQPVPLLVEGPSAGAAFAMGLTMVLVPG